MRQHAWTYRDAAEALMERIAQCESYDEQTWAQIADEIIDSTDTPTALEQLSRDAQLRRALDARRVNLILTARANGHEWLAISEATGMTPFGCRKAIAKARREQSATDES